MLQGYSGERRIWRYIEDMLLVIELKSMQMDLSGKRIAPDFLRMEMNESLDGAEIEIPLRIFKGRVLFELRRETLFIPDSEITRIDFETNEKRNRFSLFLYSSLAVLESIRRYLGSFFFFPIFVIHKQTYSIVS